MGCFGTAKKKKSGQDDFFPGIRIVRFSLYVLVPLSRVRIATPLVKGSFLVHTTGKEVLVRTKPLFLPTRSYFNCCDSSSLVGL